MRGKIVLVGIFIAALLALAGFFTLRDKRTGQTEQMESLALPTEQTPIQYCDLANHPELYDGQTVRVTATLYFMMHGFKFMDKACLGDEKETAVIFNPAHQREVVKKLAKATGGSAAGADEFNPWNFPKIIATGKFSRVTPSHKSDTVADNSNLLFEIDEVEQVLGCERVPNDCGPNMNK